MQATAVSTRQVQCTSADAGSIRMSASQTHLMEIEQSIIEQTASEPITRAIEMRLYLDKLIWPTGDAAMAFASMLSGCRN